MKLFLCQLCLLFIFNVSLAQQVTFEKYYDFGATEAGYCVQQTPDDGYIIVGSYNSAATGSDLLIMKTNSMGNLLWEKTYGGPDVDAGQFVQNTFDGGFIVTGVKDFITNSNSKIWLLKMDGNGDTIWTKTITAGIGANISNYVQQTTDSGYFIAGYTSARGSGANDVFIVKTNVIGDTLWTKTFGGSGADGAYSAQQTSDGGYVVAGGTSSFGQGGDMYLIKTDSIGDTLWTKTYGGYRVDVSYSVQETYDGGYILAGYTESFLDTIFSDAYIVRTNSSGDTLWTRSYGTLYDGESFTSIKQTSDSGFIAVGDAADPSLTNGNLWVVKTNSIGDTLWTRSYGGSRDELAYYICKTYDGGYISVGQTNSFTPYPNSDDVYLLKMDSIGFSVTGLNDNIFSTKSFLIYPNPFSYYATIILPETLNLRDTQLVLYNLFGKPELIINNCISNKIEILSGNLSAGMYFIQITNESKIVYTQKIIIQ